MYNIFIISIKALKLLNIFFIIYNKNNIETIYRVIVIKIECLIICKLVID